MVTRGCVGIGTLSSWRGIYNHDDSYPKELGKEVWGYLQKIIKKNKDLKNFSDLLGYESWVGYLHRRKGTRANTYIITSDFPDPFYMEWVYIVDVHNEMFHVLKGEVEWKSKEKISTSEKEITPRFDGTRVWDYGNSICWHALIASFPIRGPEPDWESLQTAD